MLCSHCYKETIGTTTPTGNHIALCPTCYIQAYHHRPGLAPGEKQPPDYTWTPLPGEEDD